MRFIRMNGWILHMISRKSSFTEGKCRYHIYIDNTLVPHGAPADERAVQLFERLRAIGFHTCLLSNNKEARVAPFAGQVRIIFTRAENRSAADKQAGDAPDGNGRALDDVCRISSLRMYQAKWTGIPA